MSLSIPVTFDFTSTHSQLTGGPPDGCPALDLICCFTDHDDFCSVAILSMAQLLHIQSKVDVAHAPDPGDDDDDD